MIFMIIAIIYTLYSCYLILFTQLSAYLCIFIDKLLSMRFLKIVSCISNYYYVLQKPRPIFKSV